MAFTEHRPTLESTWRSIILFGRNVASYKFALGKSLLELSEAGRSFVKLEELAEPFSRHLVEHISNVDKQATSPSSAFLDACRSYAKGHLPKEALLETTVRRGFNNVIDAFHIVNQGEVERRFFQDERSSRQGIVLTDALLELRENPQFKNLPHEVEARWRLVETAWSLGLPSRLVQVNHDPAVGAFYVDEGPRRTTITAARDALNGYQKGKCFYCSADISVNTGSEDLADVDHFFPWTLLQFQGSPNLDGVWNLVLSCGACNRLADGKFARVPTVEHLERLHRRNTFFIQSHHPLRETLINQTGQTDVDRRAFLERMDRWAIELLQHRWSPIRKNAPHL
jgi:hypothetical protein